MTPTSSAALLGLGSVAAAAVLLSVGGAGPLSIADTPGPPVVTSREAWTVAVTAPAGPVASRPTAEVTPAAAAPRWRWPARPRPRVVRPFRAPSSSWGAGHRGLDLAVAAGDPVRTVEGGVVTHAGVIAGRGTVTVTHADGLRSTYEPVTAAVEVGRVLSTGDVVGTMARPQHGGHCGAAACLHLGAVQATGYLDPLPLLAGGRVRLLPLGDG